MTLFEFIVTSVKLQLKLLSGKFLLLTFPLYITLYSMMQLNISDHERDAERSVRPG